MKNHLKKYAAPRSWNIFRKDETFIKKPNPGPHNQQTSQTIDLTLKQLNIAKNKRDIKYILNTQELLIDGRRVKKDGFPIGIMDSLTLNKKHYRMTLDKKGRLSIKEIPAQEANYKIIKITKKTTIKKGKTQLCFNDGRTLLVDKSDYAVGDSVIITLPEQEIKEHLPLKTKAEILLVSGKHSGTRGELTSITGEKISYKEDKTQTETLKDYALVIGPTKLITIP